MKALAILLLFYGLLFGVAIASYFSFISIPPVRVTVESLAMADIGTYVDITVRQVGPYYWIEHEESWSDLLLNLLGLDGLKRMSFLVSDGYETVLFTTSKPRDWGVHFVVGQGYQWAGRSGTFQLVGKVYEGEGPGSEHFEIKGYDLPDYHIADEGPPSKIFGHVPHLIALAIFGCPLILVPLELPVKLPPNHREILVIVKYFILYGIAGFAGFLAGKAILPPPILWEFQIRELGHQMRFSIIPLILTIVALIVGIVLVLAVLGFYTEQRKKLEKLN